MDGVADQAMERKGGDGEVPWPGAEAEAFGAECEVAGIGAAATMAAAFRQLGEGRLAVWAEFRLPARPRGPAQRAERRSAQVAEKANESG